MHPATLAEEWTGVITYGKNYGAYKGKELFFNLNMDQTGNAIEGFASDSYGTGVNPTPATIKGTFDGRQITFVKQYGRMQRAGRNGISVTSSKPGRPIRYSGSYDEQSGTFSGEWFITQWVLILGLIPYKWVCGGTWSMRRV